MNLVGLLAVLIEMKILLLIAIIFVLECFERSLSLFLFFLPFVFEVTNSVFFGITSHFVRMRVISFNIYRKGNDVGVILFSEILIAIGDILNYTLHRN